MGNVRAMTCPPKMFRQFCGVFAMLERREPAPRQYLPREALPDIPVKTAAILWRDGDDTCAIARGLCIPEASVWNAMDTIRAEARARRQSA